MSKRITHLLHRQQMLNVLALTLICLTCFSPNGFSQKFHKEGNLITYKGNKIEVSKPRFDTVHSTDPANGDLVTKVYQRDPVPLKVNNEKICKDRESTTRAKFSNGREKLDEYMINSLQPATGGLPDGNYHLTISNIVIDKTGNVTYYTNGGFQKITLPGEKPYYVWDNKVTAAIEKMMDNFPSFTPATLNNEPVPYLIPELLATRKLVIHDHKLSIADAN